MLIKLLDTIDWELQVIGCKPGDVVDGHPDPDSKVGCVHFDKRVKGHTYFCSIWPTDYEIIHKSFTLQPNLQ